MECPVCYQEHTGYKLNCGHSFCYQCIFHWYQEYESRTCPICRQDIFFDTREVHVDCEHNSSFDDYLQFHIPNNPVENPQKKIWFQMTYYASGTTGSEPELLSLPSNVSVNLISKIQLDEHYYYHAIWEITIEPNPDEEWIWVRPRDCTVYVDEVVIDTICIPEPASLGLLFVTSGLVAFIRRIFIV